MINACRKRGGAAALGLDLLGHAGVHRGRKRIGTLRACDGAEKPPKGAIMGYFWIELRLVAQSKVFGTSFFYFLSPGSRIG